jgi:glycerol dehydrogenase-like iron-containing ADH family enzyme
MGGYSFTSTHPAFAVASNGQHNANVAKAHRNALAYRAGVSAGAFADHPHGVVDMTTAVHDDGGMLSGFSKSNLASSASHTFSNISGAFGGNDTFYEGS